MRATLDWSWELLTPVQQEALAQCSVFTGSFDLATAEQVLDLADGAVLDALSALVQQSLVHSAPSEHDDVRLRLTDSVRAYGRARLSEAS